jgi:glycosyltransferase involved in cell wall biosynthesis
MVLSENGSGVTIAVLSLEPWDAVWRRNQHLASRVAAAGKVESVIFINPPRGGLVLRSEIASPVDRVTTVTPPMVVPRRSGGFHVLDRWRRRALRGVDVIWANDPVAGAGLISLGVPMLYDVTDDWRSMPQSDRDRRRIIRAEDRLASAAATVVCSDVLAERWRTRYGIEAEIVHNGVDVARIRGSQRRELVGPGPHAVYAGTLHENRLDVALTAQFAKSWSGTVHLVGPDHLTDLSRESLTAAGARIEGPVESAEVPQWLVSADLLVCPHLVDDFTMSLDAIKSYEYLATDRPVVATPSSGFQNIQAPGLSVVSAAEFAGAARRLVGTPAPGRDLVSDWSDRAAQFWNSLESVADKVR